MKKINKKVLLLSAFAVFMAIVFIGGAVIAKSENSNNGKFCTMDAKLCPDGSSVGRIGSSCEFAACPNSSASPSASASPSTSASPSASASPSTSVSPSASASPSATSTPKNRGQINAQEHRSVVANFVQSLVHVANRDGGIGEQVRVIAHEQSLSASTTLQAMQIVQTRSKVKTFFLGTDYDNVGALRTQMVMTRNRLTQLSNLMLRTQNASSTEEIRNQVLTLEEEQAKIQNFIDEQENKFSLFGWLVKLFR